MHPGTNRYTLALQDDADDAWRIAVIGLVTGTMIGIVLSIIAVLLH